MKLEISVVIPVYNAARFLKKAIESAVMQEEVAQVLVIDDGSTDGSFELIKELQKTHSKVKLFTHPNRVNKGRSATRNLGIINADKKYIAFLDADDYFLSNRFEMDQIIFNKFHDCDGVYNAVGFEIYDASKKDIDQVKQLYTVNQKVAPEALFEGLITGKIGHFQINGLTVKKELFNRTGLFNEDLEVAEDSDIFWKMAMVGKLYTGEISKPVSIRGVHDSNSFYQEELYANNIFKMYDSLISWSSRNKVSFARIDLLLKWYWILKHKQNVGLWKETILWGSQFINSPRIISSSLFVKYFPLIRRRKTIFPFLK